MTTHHEEPDFPVLDTLRAVGALAVLTTHTTFQSGDYLGHGVWGILLSRLDVGVAIFFVLSGFLLSRPYLARAAAGRPRPATGRYYWKRLLRIYPAYVAAVLVAMLFIDENGDAGPSDWVATLLLADTYVEGRLPQGLTQMWSLAVEVAFYVALPALMLLATGRRRLAARRISAVLAGMALVSIAWHLVVASTVDDVSSGLPYSWLPAYLTWFAVGIALALAHELHGRGSGHPVVRTLVVAGGMPGACWTMAAGLMLTTATPLAGPSLLFVATPAESLFKHVVYAAVGGLLVVTGVFASPSSPYVRWVGAKPLRHLGRISYSVFCIHLCVLAAVMAVLDVELFRGHGVQIWAVTLVLSLVASEVLYRVVELPGLRLKDAAPPWSPTSSATKGNADAMTTR